MLRKKKILITGGVGFIGSHLAGRLADENRITILDNLSSGKMENIEHLKGVEFYKADLLKDDISGFFRGMDCVFHLAANPEVRTDADRFKEHFELNFTATKNVLEQSRKSGIKNFYFASSSAVYGEARIIPTPESYGPLEPISIYGASKLASEALVSTYSHYFGLDSLVFRFANIIGKGCHGVVPDFASKLKKNQSQMEILGDGMQKKSYLYISDCIDAVIFAVEKSSKPFDVFNIGSEDDIIVKRIAEIVSVEMGLKPRFSYTGGIRGWKGDIPVMKLNIDKIKKLGWKPKYNSEEAVRKTAKEIISRQFSAC